MKKTKSFEMTCIESGRILSDQEKMDAKGGILGIKLVNLTCEGFIGAGPADWTFGVLGACVCDNKF